MRVVEIYYALALDRDQLALGVVELIRLGHNGWLPLRRLRWKSRGRGYDGRSRVATRPRVLLEDKFAT
jgi:hypothetical protein